MQNQKIKSYEDKIKRQTVVFDVRQKNIFNTLLMEFLSQENFMQVMYDENLREIVTTIDVTMGNIKSMLAATSLDYEYAENRIVKNIAIKICDIFSKFVKENYADNLSDVDFIFDPEELKYKWYVISGKFYEDHLEKICETLAIKLIANPNFSPIFERKFLWLTNPEEDKRLNRLKAAEKRKTKMLNK